MPAHTSGNSKPGIRWKKANDSQCAILIREELRGGACPPAGPSASLNQRDADQAPPPHPPVACMPGQGAAPCVPCAALRPQAAPAHQCFRLWRAACTRCSPSARVDHRIRRQTLQMETLQIEKVLFSHRLSSSWHAGQPISFACKPSYSLSGTSVVVKLSRETEAAECAPSTQT